MTRRMLSAGRIALQANKGAVAFRNIKLRPRKLEKIKLDKDLSGWKVFPGKMAEYSVTDKGQLQVKNGPGMLEYTAREYGDFVLSCEVMTNAKNLNSGVFFRQIPGEFTQGYECQVHNGTKDGDPKQPLDCGTGGFYRRSNARLVNGRDLDWTRITLMVHGPHMAAWVNGLQVSDWTDDRKPDDNPRKGLRTKQGTLSIQGHDPTTDILFQDFQISELPKRNKNGSRIGRMIRIKYGSRHLEKFDLHPSDSSMRDPSISRVRDIVHEPFFTKSSGFVLTVSCCLLGCLEQVFSQ